jgi:hypothetical protein
MRKVKAFGPSLPPPHVPEYLVLDDGTVVRKGDLAVPREDFELPLCVEVPDYCWVGVRQDGRVDVFAAAEEGPWRARESERCVASANEIMKTNPLKSVEMLKGAASLVGLNMPLLVQGLEARRNPGESLDETFVRLKKS